MSEPPATHHRVEAVRHLAAGIAHEFANALTAIGGLAYLIRTEATLERQTEEDLDEIRKMTDEAARLARELMAFGLSQVTEPAHHRLTEIVRHLRRLLPHMLPVGIRVVEHAPAADIDVWADPQQISEVAVVLAADAKERMAGRGELAIGTRREDVDEAAAQALGVRPGRYGVLEIASSAGVEPPAEGRAPDALADAARVIRETGGALTSKSTDGARIFRLYLPLAEAPKPEPLAPMDHAADGGTETILLVDDDAELADVVTRLLQARGYTVLMAADGDQALSTAAAFDGPIHLLLSDVVMPGLSGLDLMKRLTAARPNIRVLFMSGYPQDLPADVPFIRKPFSADALAATIREVLRHTEHG